MGRGWSIVTGLGVERELVTKTAHQRVLSVLFAVGLVTVTVAACSSDKSDTKTGAASSVAPSSSGGPKVAFSSPTNGATVKSPIQAAMTVSGFTVEPAGDVHPGAGHLHVIIDVGCVAPDSPVPKDDNHVHLGKGQLSTELTLTPGTHKLCLQAGDGAHTALPITDEISITVSA